LANASREAFMSGVEVSPTVGALVALCGSLLVCTCLPSKPMRGPTNADVRAPEDARPFLSSSIDLDQLDSNTQVPRDAMTIEGEMK
jgi:hypothetical protein